MRPLSLFVCLFEEVDRGPAKKYKEIRYNSQLSRDTTEMLGYCQCCELGNLKSNVICLPHYFNTFLSLSLLNMHVYVLEIFVCMFTSIDIICMYKPLCFRKI